MEDPAEVGRRRMRCRVPGTVSVLTTITVLEPSYRLNYRSHYCLPYFRLRILRVRSKQLSRPNRISSKEEVCSRSKWMWVMEDWSLIFDLCQILGRLKGRKHVAELIHSGKKAKFQYMVMSLLGESLNNLLKWGNDQMVSHTHCSSFFEYRPLQGNGDSRNDCGDQGGGCNLKKVDLWSLVGRLVSSARCPLNCASAYTCCTDWSKCTMWARDQRSKINPLPFSGRFHSPRYQAGESGDGQSEWRLGLHHH